MLILLSKLLNAGLLLLSEYFYTVVYMKCSSLPISEQLCCNISNMESLLFEAEVKKRRQ